MRDSLKMAFPRSVLMVGRRNYHTVLSRITLFLRPENSQKCSRVWVSQRNICTKRDFVTSSGIIQPHRSMCSTSHQVNMQASSKQIYTFDTHELIMGLQSAGFTESQAEAIKQCLVQVSAASTDFQSKNLVTKSEQEVMMQQILAHLGAIKKDMIILEKSEFSQLKHEYEKQNIAIVQLKQTLNDEVQKLRGGVSLDLNLERSRSKEDHDNNVTNLATLKNDIGLHNMEVEKQLVICDNKIDKEIAKLLATYERYRNDVMKYAGGTVMTCLTICLGFYRLWS